MICPKCRRAMAEQKRVFHGRRKWICPVCKKVRFQKAPTPRLRKHVDE